MTVKFPSAYSPIVGKALACSIDYVKTAAVGDTAEVRAVTDAFCASMAPWSVTVWGPRDSAVELKKAVAFKVVIDGVDAAVVATAGKFGLWSVGSVTSTVSKDDDNNAETPNVDVEETVAGFEVATADDSTGGAWVAMKYLEVSKLTATGTTARSTTKLSVEFATNAADTLVADGDMIGV
jgi:hypothetical protein